ncbi:MAG TPA: anthranilate synthase component I [Candidatus Methylacidiphilales bacterium]|nr:anthranilate synthase component I [Candidatus Methylacidiphilales bacterium]
MLFPSRQIFAELARQGNLIPVYREILADVDTPVSAYLKIAGARQPSTHAFLLESVEQGGRFSRYSFCGSNPSIVLTTRGKQATLREGAETKHYSFDGDPLRELQKLMSRYKPISFGQLPIFYGGAVGYLAYEAVTSFEPSVPRAKNDDLNIPDSVFVISDTLLIFDHHERRIKIVANAHVHDGDANAAYDDAERKINELTALVQSPLSTKVLALRPGVPDIIPGVNMTREDYVAMTEKMQEYIKAGDIFQVVPSQRFEVPYTGDPIELYRALRLINPSPYMFCLRMGDVTLVGASPEVHVRCEEGKVEIRPIAGTRPRRDSAVEDEAMARELLADPKERAEHVMLVDLARNDVGRVCQFHTVRVTDFMKVERFSHVMHIVSNVEGMLKPGYSQFDVMRATFPAGTVSGSPKVRAMQIIAEQEPTCRGSYAGAVGYFGFSGNLDSCIAIRTILIKDGKAYLQAGGGLVADSTPMGEYQESVNKAKAGIKALGMAGLFQ